MLALHLIVVCSFISARNQFRDIHRCRIRLGFLCQDNVERRERKRKKMQNSAFGKSTKSPLWILNIIFLRLRLQNQIFFLFVLGNCHATTMTNEAFMHLQKKSISLRIQFMLLTRFRVQLSEEGLCFSRWIKFRVATTPSDEGLKTNLE